MPITVILIGMLSVVLFYTIHRVRVHQAADTSISNAVLHIEITTAIFHLHVDEIIAGESSGSIGVIDSVDEAIRLTDVILAGAVVPGQGLHSWQVRSIGLRTGAEEMKSLLLSFKLTGLDLIRNCENKMSICTAGAQQFDASFDEILSKAAVLEDICKRNEEVNQQKTRKIVLSSYIVWAFIIVTSAAGFWWIEMRRKAAEDLLLAANRRLHTQAGELTAHRENLRELVEARTNELTVANELLKIENAERMRTEEKLRESEKQNRQLSSNVLEAQEIERKRLSMELHDGLGQALNVLKLRIRIVEKGLRTDQDASRVDCENLLEYLDGIIEEVHQISQAGSQRC